MRRVFTYGGRQVVINRWVAMQLGSGGAPDGSPESVSEVLDRVLGLIEGDAFAGPTIRGLWVAEVDENSSGWLLILTDGTRRVLCFVSFRPGGEDWVLSEFGNIYVSLASPT